MASDGDNSNISEVSSSASNTTGVVAPAAGLFQGISLYSQSLSAGASSSLSQSNSLSQIQSSASLPPLPAYNVVTSPKLQHSSSSNKSSNEYCRCCHEQRGRQVLLSDAFVFNTTSTDSKNYVYLCDTCAPFCESLIRMTNNQSSSARRNDVLRAFAGRNRLSLPIEHERVPDRMMRIIKQTSTKQETHIAKNLLPYVPGLLIDLLENQHIVNSIHFIDGCFSTNIQKAVVLIIDVSGYTNLAEQLCKIGAMNETTTTSSLSSVTAASPHDHRRSLSVMSNSSTSSQTTSSTSSGLSSMANMPQLNVMLKKKVARGVETLVQDGLNKYFSQLVQCCYKHGGDVIKFAGDALICLFHPSLGRLARKYQKNIETVTSARSYDSVSESQYNSMPSNINSMDDDFEYFQSLAQAALLCAKSCVELVHSVDVGSTTSTLTCHCGIATGSVNVMTVGGVGGRRELLITGDTIRVAGEALEHAGSRGVVVCENTYSLVHTICRTRIATTNSPMPKKSNLASAAVNGNKAGTTLGTSAASGTNVRGAGGASKISQMLGEKVEKVGVYVTRMSITSHDDEVASTSGLSDAGSGNVPGTSAAHTIGHHNLKMNFYHIDYLTVPSELAVNQPLFGPSEISNKKSFDAAFAQRMGGTLQNVSENGDITALKAYPIHRILDYVASFVPRPIVEWVSVGQQVENARLNEVRLVSVIFMKLGNIGYGTAMSHAPGTPPGFNQNNNIEKVSTRATDTSNDAPDPNLRRQKTPTMDDAAGEDGQLLQTVFITCQNVVKKRNGMVRQFIVDDKGCVLIVVFGVNTFTHNDDAYRAVATAWDLVKEIGSLDAKDGFERKIDTSIGITTGRAFCGSVGFEHPNAVSETSNSQSTSNAPNPTMSARSGTPQQVEYNIKKPVNLLSKRSSSGLENQGPTTVGDERREYAIVGDCVNLSARLMSAASKLGKSIICDEITYQRAESAVDFDFDKLDPIKVKGKADPIPIYSPTKIVSNDPLTRATNIDLQPVPITLITTPYLNSQGYKKTSSNSFDQTQAREPSGSISNAFQGGVAPSPLTSAKGSFDDPKNSLLLTPSQSLPGGPQLGDSSTAFPSSLSEVSEHDHLCFGRVEQRTQILNLLMAFARGIADPWILIDSEPGLGKSRVLEWTCHILKLNYPTIKLYGPCRCSMTSVSNPFDGIRQILFQILGVKSTSLEKPSFMVFAGKITIMITSLRSKIRQYSQQTILKSGSVGNDPKSNNNRFVDLVHKITQLPKVQQSSQPHPQPPLQQQQQQQQLPKPILPTLAAPNLARHSSTGGIERQSGRFQSPITGSDTPNFAHEQSFRTEITIQDFPSPKFESAPTGRKRIQSVTFRNGETPNLQTQTSTSVESLTNDTTRRKHQTRANNLRRAAMEAAALSISSTTSSAGTAKLPSFSNDEQVPASPSSITVTRMQEYDDEYKLEEFISNFPAIANEIDESVIRLFLFHPIDQLTRAVSHRLLIGKNAASAPGTNGLDGIISRKRQNDQMNSPAGDGEDGSLTEAQVYQLINIIIIMSLFIRKGKYCFVVDDIHFLDDTSWDLLFRISSCVPGTMFLTTTTSFQQRNDQDINGKHGSMLSKSSEMLLAATPGATAPLGMSINLARLRRKPFVHILELRPLDREALGALLSYSFRVSQWPDIVIDQVMKTSKGHPLWALEMIKGMVAEHMIILDENRSVCTLASEKKISDIESAFQHGLEGSILQRFDSLSPVRQEVLKRCCVVIGSFTPEMIAYMFACPLSVSSYEAIMEDLVYLEGLLKHFRVANQEISFFNHNHAAILKKQSENNERVIDGDDDDEEEEFESMPEPPLPTNGTLPTLELKTLIKKNEDDERSENSRSPQRSGGRRNFFANIQKEYVFGHDIVRGIIYNTIPFVEKRRHHLRIAEFIENNREDTIRNSYPILAEHYSAAGEPERALECTRLAAISACEDGLIEDAKFFLTNSLALSSGILAELTSANSAESLEINQEDSKALKKPKSFHHNMLSHGLFVGALARAGKAVISGVRAATTATAASLNSQNTDQSSASEANDLFLEPERDLPPVKVITNVDIAEIIVDLSAVEILLGNTDTAIENIRLLHQNQFKDELDTQIDELISFRIIGAIQQSVRMFSNPDKKSNATTRAISKRSPDTVADAIPSTPTATSNVLNQASQHQQQQQHQLVSAQSSSNVLLLFGRGKQFIIPSQKIDILFRSMLVMAFTLYFNDKGDEFVNLLKKMMAMLRIHAHMDNDTCPMAMFIVSVIAQTCSSRYKKRQGSSAHVPLKALAKMSGRSNFEMDPLGMDEIIMNWVYPAVLNESNIGNRDALAILFMEVCAINFLCRGRWEKAIEFAQITLNRHALSHINFIRLQVPVECQGITVFSKCALGEAITAYENLEMLTEQSRILKSPQTSMWREALELYVRYRIHGRIITGMEGDGDNSLGKIILTERENLLETDSFFADRCLYLSSWLWHHVESMMNRQLPVDEDKIKDITRYIMLEKKTDGKMEIRNWDHSIVWYQSISLENLLMAYIAMGCPEDFEGDRILLRGNDLVNSNHNNSNNSINKASTDDVPMMIANAIRKLGHVFDFVTPIALRLKGMIYFIRGNSIKARKKWKRGAIKACNLKMNYEYAFCNFLLESSLNENYSTRTLTASAALKPCMSLPNLGTFFGNGQNNKKGLRGTRSSKYELSPECSANYLKSLSDYIERYDSNLKS